MSIEGIDTSRDGGHPGLWAATDRGEESEWLNATNPAYLRASQQAWRRAIEADFPWDGDIQCDPRTFMPLANVQLITLGVIGGPSELRVRALEAACERMHLVGADGREAETSEEVEEWDDEQDDSYTINYVSDPQIDGAVVGLSNIDTKGMRPPWMMRTFLRIVAEELRAAGALPARIVPFVTAQTRAWLAEQGERLPELDEMP